MQLKNKLLQGTLAAVCGFLLTSCKETRTEYSQVLHEDATVVDLVYTPSRHGSGTGVGPTITPDGKIGVGVTFVRVNIPEKYAVVFKCQHGKFIIEGANERYKNLWSRFSEGEEVDVTYREMYKSVYDDINGDGKEDLLERTLIKYDFLDAQPKKK